MFSKLTKNSSVKEICVISLTNIGDVVLTTPVLDILLEDFPLAGLTVVVGPKARSLYGGQTRIKTVVFEKRKPFGYYMEWYKELNRTPFDVLVDLRQTFLPLFLRHQWRTPIGTTKCEEHMLQKHLRRLKTVYPQAQLFSRKQAVVPKPVALPFDDFIVIAPGAADTAKRWPIENFRDLIVRLSKEGAKIILVGDDRDALSLQPILDLALPGVVSMAGKTDLRELCFVLSRSKFLIAHDSGIMHLANYMEVPHVVLWGPTDQKKYGPWRSKHAVVHKGRDMSQINLKDVVNAIEQIR